MPAETVTEILKSIGDEVKSLKGDVAKLKEKAPGQANPNRIFGIRKGESPLSSRGYSFVKAIGLAVGKLSAEDARIENEIHSKINKSLREQGYRKENDGVMMMPFASAHMEDSIAQDCRDLVLAGGAADPDEVRHIRKSMYQKDMSWNIDTSGGTLIPAPAQGELIELLRNKAALMAAGARVIPMPAQGSTSLPKQTGASTAYWVGENTTITASDLTTGNLLLRAKKLAGLMAIPNELFRYSSPAADAVCREDLVQVLQLAMDLAGLSGAGSATSPKGIFNYSVNSYTPKKQGTNGDAFGPEDFFGMIGKTHAVNGIVNEEAFAFIIRPELFYNIMAKRADAVSAGDGQGSFVQWSTDQYGNLQYRAAGKKVIVSNQIAADRTKASSGATLTRVLGGDMSQWIIAMAAALEIEQNRYSDTAFTKDQTQIRAILQVDMGPRHEESFTVADYLRVDAKSA